MSIFIDSVHILTAVVSAWRSKHDTLSWKDTIDKSVGRFVSVNLSSQLINTFLSCQRQINQLSEANPQRAGTRRCMGTSWAVTSLGFRCSKTAAAQTEEKKLSPPASSETTCSCKRASNIFSLSLSDEWGLGQEWHAASRSLFHAPDASNP